MKALTGEDLKNYQASIVPFSQLQKTEFELRAGQYSQANIKNPVLKIVKKQTNKAAFTAQNKKQFLTQVNNALDLGLINHQPQYNRSQLDKIKQILEELEKLTDTQDRLNLSHVFSIIADFLKIHIWVTEDKQNRRTRYFVYKNQTEKIRSFLSNIEERIEIRLNAGSIYSNDGIYKLSATTGNLEIFGAGMGIPKKDFPWNK